MRIGTVMFYGAVAVVPLAAAFVATGSTTVCTVIRSPGSWA